MMKEYKQKSIVSGKSINDIMNMKPKEFNDLSFSDLKKLTGRLVSAANKRVRTFQKHNETSPALEKMERTGGIFSVKGKDLNELKIEFFRIKDFLQNKTSVRKEWEKIKKKVKEETGLNKPESKKKPKEIEKEKTFISEIEPDLEEPEIEIESDIKEAKNDEEFLKEFWQTFERLKELDKSFTEKKLKYTALREIQSQMEEGKSQTEILKNLSNRVSELYEKEKESEFKKHESISHFFEFENDL